jgi:hypothetical protein
VVPDANGPVPTPSAPSQLPMDIDIHWIGLRDPREMATGPPRCTALAVRPCRALAEIFHVLALARATDPDK